MEKGNSFANKVNVVGSTIMRAILRKPTNEVIWGQVAKGQRGGSFVTEVIVVRRTIRRGTGNKLTKEFIGRRGHYNKGDWGKLILRREM